MIPKHEEFEGLKLNKSTVRRFSDKQTKKEKQLASYELFSCII